MSLFGILSLSGQALITNQIAINSTSKNMANVNTEGYMRENAVIADLPRGSIDIAKIERIFNANLYKRYIDLNQKSSSAESYKQLLTSIENLFSDNMGTGFASALNQFFNSLNDTIINPNDLSARYQVLTNAKALIGRIRETASNLDNIKQTTYKSLEDTINQINNLTSQLAQINKNIKIYQNDKSVITEYENQRDQIIKQLSDLINTKINYNQDGTVSVFTAKGFGLVVGNNSYNLSIQQDSNGFPIIRWNNTNDITNDIQNGEVGGNLKGLNVLKQIYNDLNDFTTIFATVLNKQHSQGYDLNGNTGINLFKADNGASKIDATNIALNISAPEDLALASDPNNLNSDNTNAKALLALKDNINGVLTLAEETTLTGSLFTASNYDFIKLRNFSEFYNTKLVGIIGSLKSDANQKADNAKALTDAVDAQIKSLSAVNLDEELINLTKLQRAYEASARIISITNNLLDTVINLGK
ncbi:flagellar hook-associated protein FlgK [Venenivibrio stagnispumantis]|uniref:Flagellar hook-associated protein 1 n=1 Tax=Venenivibrio stagnispumantis TaxID=407998 RepID=A0AA45WPS0_9AQUI|nr:flagellar hook-associated protein FlgK [Venenivibrio stagnispumantis]MCW4572702.1 flagellar hook-associated protein FlgK [Venenivibrio stagnispumantis]SMP22785.1 flagellar hook-associated protein 1 FlgK [Venenivibrio stagnispumantis]